MTDSTNPVVGKTILQLDPLTGAIDFANSYIEVHVVGQESSQKVPLGSVSNDGKSAYQVAVDNGFVGTETQWLASLVGANGKSAYQSALDTGFVGTEAQFVQSLVGAQGPQGATGAQGAAGATGATGQSAYQAAVAAGFSGDITAWLASLKGDKGDTGAIGAQGPVGPAGTAGNAFIATAGAPAAGVGNNGDMAFDAANSTIYGPKAAGAWPAGVVLKGPAGAQGATGAAGTAGTNGNTILTTTGAPAAGVGNNGDYAYDPAALTMYGPKAAGAWPAGVLIKGATGAQGAQGQQGAAGAVGNSAYQDAVAQGFVGTLPQWLASLQGAQGPQGLQGPAGADGAQGPKGNDGAAGATGAQGPTGPTGPAGAQGATGEVGASAYQTAVAHGFVGDEPTWLASLQGQSAYQQAVTAGFVGDMNAWLASLKGAKGDTGAQGATGPAGTNGSTILQTSGAPAAGLGNNGDYAVDTTASMFYGPKAAGAWPAGVSIVGPQGIQGPAGGQGPQGPAGAAGSNSVLGHLVGSVATSADLPDVSGFEQADYFFVGTHVWMNLNGAWTDMGDFQGLPGRDGSGITVLGSLPSSTYLPATGQRNGDAWLIGTVMYVWNGTIWQLQGQQGLQGPQGPVGPTGATGSSAWDVIRAQHPEVNTPDLFAAYIRGAQGPQGDSAVAFITDGTLPDVGSLPATGTQDHGYLVSNGSGGYDYWVWVNTQFVNLGSNVGPTGPQGPAGANGGQGVAGRSMTAKGTLANPSLLPSTGNSVADTYSIAGHFWSWDGAQWVDNGDFTGPQGATGPQGPTGQAVNPKGQLTNVSQLPSTGNANGDAYEINGYIYVYNTAQAQFVNMGQWRGANGVSFTYIGQFANQAALPTGTQTGNSATTADTNHLFLWEAGSGWVDNGPAGAQGPVGAAGPQGVQGQSAYDAAVANGFVGNITQWLASLVGAEGPVGPQGVAGPKGDTGATGAQGPQGPTGNTGATGAQGPTGNTGPAGAQGATGATGPAGTSLAYIGDFANSGAIPAGTLSQVATAGGHIFINNGTTWVDAGPVAQGPQGPQGATGATGNTGATGQSAYQAAVAGGFVGTQAQWLASLVGPTGASAVQDAITAGKLQPGATINDYIVLTTGPQGPQGDQGPQGSTGPAISIIGTLTDSSQLPATGTAGTGYAIPDSSSPGTYNCWIWLSTTTQWFNLGHVVGAQGPQGVQGLRGLQGVTGPQGPTGATGTLWIVLARDPQAQDGRVGDYFFNSNTQEFFTKTNAATWASLGHIGGGNLNAPSQTGKLRAYSDTGWVDLPDVVNVLPNNSDNKLYSLKNGEWTVLPDMVNVPPSLTDGKLYSLKNGEWIVLPDLVNVLPSLTDGKIYALKNGEWVAQTLLSTIPADSGTYQLVNGAWKSMDTYTLKAMDVALSAGVGTVDLNVARIFRIQNTATTTINIVNPPDASHGTTVVIKVYGKVGAFTWTLPSGSIRWFDGSPPPFTNSTTTIVLQWDGTEWVGSVPN